MNAFCVKAVIHSLVLSDFCLADCLKSFGKSELCVEKCVLPFLRMRKISALHAVCQEASCPFPGSSTMIKNECEP